MKWKIFRWIFLDANLCRHHTKVPKLPNVLVSVPVDYYIHWTWTTLLERRSMLLVKGTEWRSQQPTQKSIRIVACGLWKVSLVLGLYCSCGWVLRSDPIRIRQVDRRSRSSQAYWVATRISEWPVSPRTMVLTIHQRGCQRRRRRRNNNNKTIRMLPILPLWYRIAILPRNYLHCDRR